MNKFDQLAADTLAKLLEFGIRSKTAVNTFKRNCKMLGSHLAKAGKDFSLEAGLQWIAEQPSASRASYSTYVQESARRRAVLLLADCRAGRLTEWRIYQSIRATVPQSQEYTVAADLHCERLVTEGKACATVSFARRVAHDFLIFLERAGAPKLCDIHAGYVTGYFLQEKFCGRKPDGIKAYAYRLRIFMLFLEETDLVRNKALHLAVPKSFAKQVSIVTTLSDAAVGKLTADGLFKTNVGLRDKAMIFLALRLGIRKSDIINLKMSDINWSEDKIVFTQKKTGIPISLPLLPDVGNAIVDYMLEARPSSSSEFVFLRAYAPYNALNCCGSLLRRYLAGMPKSDCPQFGMHILRRTLATSMLRAKVPRSVISAAIGQADPNSVDVYLSADSERMRECALPLDGIECGRGGLN
jgi:integrase